MKTFNQLVVYKNIKKPIKNGRSRNKKSHHQKSPIFIFYQKAPGKKTDDISQDNEKYYRGPYGSEKNQIRDDSSYDYPDQNISKINNNHPAND
jgi:hypothetical protein